VEDAVPDLSEQDRRRLGQTFDCAADFYDRYRPEYPEELFDDLIRVARLVPTDRLLEVGCATGKASAPLARRGFRITCVEPGAHLAAIARDTLAGYDIEVIEGRFEDWRPRRGERFDLLYAATAWDWVDPSVRYARAHEALRPGGHLAFWNATHVFPEGGDPFFLEIQEVYEEIGEGLPPGAAWPRPGELPDRRTEVEETGLFEIVHIRHFDWERVYTAGEYIGLLETFSGHIAMEPWKRERLFAEIRRRLNDRPDHRLRRHWGAVLHVGRSQA
jgi:SAM-dependent methyltransferase